MAQLEQKITTNTVWLPSKSYEEIVGEVVERINRSHNVIMYNVPETNCLERDKAQVEEILNHIQGDPTNPPSSIFRIGRPSPSKPRMIKAVLSTPLQARAILRNKKKLAHTLFADISFRNDKTPREMSHLHEIRTQLNRKGGEADLTIKYKQGKPRIVKNPSINIYKLVPKHI
ncbi:hypothetical protein JTB14_007587 [Gonioctena quinquepunctata]|nr:hypothetical protein JTB14_007587 [Gonioctena quinquepunctata]